MKPIEEVSEICTKEEWREPKLPSSLGVFVS
jgi:hypothetical protein